MSLVIELKPDQDLEYIISSIGKITPHKRLVDIQTRKYIITIEESISPQDFSGIEGIAAITSIDSKYPLASIDFQKQRTCVRVGNVTIGDGRPVIMAGPCSVESREQLLMTARHVAAKGCHILRGGAFKPRTSPYSFQGLGVQGLEILAEARAVTGLPVVTEVMATEDVALVAQYADMLQIGARNMQNFPLLRKVGQSGKPVLLKRSPSATINTWLQAAEYILAEGNFQVVLCERGICASEAASGKHLDLGAILRLQGQTHLPVIIDPSHGTGVRDMVIPMSLAGLVVGADGIIVEVHPDPAYALSDGMQSLSLEEFSHMMERIHRLGKFLGELVAL
jgi:3-deoxy-7-phosphoheptulonate synthase